MKTGAVKREDGDHSRSHPVPQGGYGHGHEGQHPWSRGRQGRLRDTSRWRRQRADAFRRWFAARPSSAAVLREALTTYLTANDIDDAATRLIVLCADEALINAVAHAAGSPVGVFADLRDDHFTLEVSDGGPGFDSSQIDSDAEPDLMGEHGRGLFLIRKLMDDLEILSNEHGTTLHMERDLPAVRL